MSIKRSKEQYICPNCGCDEIEVDHEYVVVPDAIQVCLCESCGQKFENHYECEYKPAEDPK